MKELKERIYDCEPTEFDPSNKERITDIRISQGPRVLIAYQRGILNERGEFVASRPYDTMFTGNRAVEIIEALETALTGVLDKLKAEKDRPGKTILEEREEFLQGQRQRIIDGEEEEELSIVPGKPREKHPDQFIT